MNGTSPSRPATGPATPWTLTAAAVVVAIQGLGLVVLGIVGIVDLVPSRLEVGLSVAVFFAAYGVGLLACAWALTRARSWARGPVLITQLIQLGVAWNARADVLLAVPLALVAAGAIAAMVHPLTIQALVDDPTSSLSADQPDGRPDDQV